MDVAGKTFIFREGATVEDTDGSACRFTSGGVTFYAMYADNNRIFYATDADLSDYITVRDGMGDWAEEAYKRITFADDEEPFSGTFAIWFAATYVEESTYTTQASSLTAVANAIRAKGGTSAELTYPDGFIDAIDNISGGVPVSFYTPTILATGTTIDYGGIFVIGNHAILNFRFSNLPSAYWSNSNPIFEIPAAIRPAGWIQLVAGSGGYSSYQALYCKLDTDGTITRSWGYFQTAYNYIYGEWDIPDSVYQLTSDYPNDVTITGGVTVMGKMCKADLVVAVASSIQTGWITGVINLPAALPVSSSHPECAASIYYRDYDFGLTNLTTTLPNVRDSYIDTDTNKVNIWLQSGSTITLKLIITWMTD